VFQRREHENYLGTQNFYIFAREGQTHTRDKTNLYLVSYILVLKKNNVVVISNVSRKNYTRLII